ncbi:hypothetical protein PENSPDRAFT_680225 [Peniophora sp. CONT]|nr:hypothetical protein PENSPDRAFT_680225 [Peniophora sp. CONT]
MPTQLAAPPPSPELAPQHSVMPTAVRIQQRRVPPFAAGIFAPLPHPIDPTSNSTSTMHNGILLPSGEPFYERFLKHILDKRGYAQPLIWILADAGDTAIDIDVMILLFQNRGIDCYGRVLRFIVSDGLNALFQIKIKGWSTDQRWHAPTTHILAYVVVPLERCTGPAHAMCQGRFLVEAPLLEHAFKAAKVAHDHAERECAEGLPDDRVTETIFEGYMANRDTLYFNTEMGTGCAFAQDDLSAKMRARRGIAPPDFNPTADSPPYLRRAPDYYELCLDLRATGPAADVVWINDFSISSSVLAGSR